MPVFDRWLYRVEIALSVLSGGLATLTLALPQWFELLFDESPDGGDGSLEAWIVIGCGAIAAILFARMAVVRRRRWSGGAA